jgi:hypothetical protein
MHGNGGGNLKKCFSVIMVAMIMMFAMFEVRKP